MARGKRKPGGLAARARPTHALPCSCARPRVLGWLGWQVARCFRDEDLRADRQPEFTQLDLEVAWMDAPALQALVEGLVAAIFKEVRPPSSASPLQRPASLSGLGAGC